MKIETNEDLDNAIRDFITYIMSNETLNKITCIDNTLNTNYVEAIQLLAKTLQHGMVITFIPKSSKYPSSNIQTLDGFKQNPVFTNITLRFVQGDPCHVIGHEFKHAIDKVAMYMKRRGEEPSPINPRLYKLLDKDNLYSEDEYIERIFKNEGSINEDTLRKEYRYITNSDEFSSNLHSVAEYRFHSGCTDIFNFNSTDEFEEVLRSGNFENDWVWDIYYYLVKDKSRFIDTINKYAFLVPVSILFTV